MAGLIESLLAMWWFKRKDRYVAKKQDQKFDREHEIRLARGGFVSSDIVHEVHFLFMNDELAMLDRVAGTLDRDSQEWKDTYNDIHAKRKRYIDGDEYDPSEYLECKYCMKVYGKKFPPYQVQ